MIRLRHLLVEMFRENCRFFVRKIFLVNEKNQKNPKILILYAFILEV